MNQHPRRTILVDRAFQLQYLRIWLWVGVLMVVLSCLFYLLFARAVLGQRSQDPEIMKLMSGVSLFLVLFCVLMGVLSIFLTHRVAGAAWRLDSCLQKMADGDLEQRIALRSGDYLQNLAARLTDLQETLRRSEQTVADHVAKLDEYKLQLARDGKIGDPEKARIDEILHPLRVTFARRGAAAPSQPVSTE